MIPKNIVKKSRVLKMVRVNVPMDHSISGKRIKGVYQDTTSNYLPEHVCIPNTLYCSAKGCHPKADHHGNCTEGGADTPFYTYKHAEVAGDDFLVSYQLKDPVNNPNCSGYHLLKESQYGTMYTWNKIEHDPTKYHAYYG